MASIQQHQFFGSFKSFQWLESVASGLRGIPGGMYSPLSSRRPGFDVDRRRTLGYLCAYFFAGAAPV